MAVIRHNTLRHLANYTMRGWRQMCQIASIWGVDTWLEDGKSSLSLVL